MNLLPDLIQYIAPVAEHYLTLHSVHPNKTYSYEARMFRDLAVVKHTRHAAKCKKGDSWTYIAVPTNSDLQKLSTEQKLYIGAQTQDRMFRGDNMPDENFHHAEMRRGRESNTLTSFLISSGSVEIFRFEAHRVKRIIETSETLKHLLPLTQQPPQPRKHLGWLFEQYVLHRDGPWLWNSKGAEAPINKILTT